MAKVFDGISSSAVDHAEYYLNEGGHVLLTFDDQRQLIRHDLYTPSADQLLAVEDFSSSTGSLVKDDVIWALADQQNRVRDLYRSDYDSQSNTTTPVYEHLKIDPFGTIDGVNSTSLSSKFATALPELQPGMVYDTDLETYLSSGRVYEPHSARFLSEDPDGIASGVDNLYTLSGNAPLKLAVDGVNHSGGFNGDIAYQNPNWAYFSGDGGHAVLDAVGVLDPFGIADIANAIWYAAEGNYGQAAISLVGLIPLLGDAAKLGRAGVKAALKSGVREGVQAASKAASKSLATSAKGIGNLADSFRSGYRPATKQDWAMAKQLFTGASIHGAAGGAVGGAIGGAAGYYQTGSWEGTLEGARSGALNGALNAAGGSLRHGYLKAAGSGSVARTVSASRGAAQIRRVDIGGLDAKSGIRTRVLASIEANKEARLSSRFDQFDRRVIARRFYHESGYSGGRLESHLSGIDFTRPVSVETMPAGSIVEQWVKGSSIGNYFNPVGQAPQLGGVARAMRTPIAFRTNTDVPVLRSYAAPITDTWTLGPRYPIATPGGGLQYFTRHSSAFDIVFGWY